MSSSMDTQIFTTLNQEFISHSELSNPFETLMSRMMRCLVKVLNGGDEASKQKALVLLIELAEMWRSFFIDVDVVIASMLKIADTESLEEGTRNLAIKFVITLVEDDVYLGDMSASLLGKLFKQCHPMSGSTDSRVKKYLLACVDHEGNKPAIELFGETISKLAPDENFANLLLDNVATLQESALLIFPHVVQYVIACKMASKVQYASNVPFELRLRIVFKRCLGNVGSANVRIAVLIAATTFIQWLMSSSEDWFQNLLMQCLDELFNGGDEEMKQKALVLLIKLAETKPTFFTEHSEEVVERMLQIADMLEGGTWSLAIKFVNTLQA